VAAGCLRIGHGDGGITGPSLHDATANGVPAAAFKRRHNLQHGIALATAQIQGEQGGCGGWIQEVFNRRSVTFCEIHHMDVIAHACAVWRGPITAKDLEFMAPAYSHLADEGEEVVGTAAGVFADLAAGMGPDRIEIAQPSDAPAGVCVAHVRQQLFNGRLRVPVGVHRLDRSVLVDRHLLGIAVQRGAAAEGDRVASVGCHGGQQLAAPRHVHIPIPQRLFNGFPNSLESGEVNHRIHRSAPGGGGEGTVEIV